MLFSQKGLKFLVEQSNCQNLNQKLQSCRSKLADTKPNITDTKVQMKKSKQKVETGTKLNCKLNIAPSNQS